MIVTVKCPECAEPLPIDIDITLASPAEESGPVVYVNTEISDLGRQTIREHAATHA